MPGNVVVDDSATEQEESPRMPAGWLLGLGAAVVLVLVLLPGQPATETPPTQVTFPEVQLEEGTWVPLDLPGSGLLRAVTPLSGDEVLAVGDGPQIWHYDGEETWRGVLLDSADPGSLAGVTRYGSGAVAVGYTRGEDSAVSPLVWRSRAGTGWNQVGMDVTGEAGLEGVFAADVQLVAWGWRGTSRDYSPDARPLLMRSADGRTWTPVDAFDDGDRLARIFTVTRQGGVWYVGGYATGRPALWKSDDNMFSWSRVGTRHLPFGWAVQEVAVDQDGTVVVTIVNLSEGRSRRWQADGDGWTPLDDRPTDPVSVVEGQEATVGVGNGRLWRETDGGWEELDLPGEVTAAIERVAVGAGPGMQPRVWIRDGDGGDVVDVPAGEGGRWTAQRDLGESDFSGAWPVADGWVIGGGEDRWWYLDESGIGEFVPPWGPLPTEIAPAGDEWVALPSMHWTSTGLEWEPRTHPWTGAGGGPVEAVAESDGRLLAVGRDAEFLWNVAASEDGGRTWVAVGDPAAATPVWDVRGTPDGFVATAARPQGAHAVVTTTDGREWEPVVAGELLFGAHPAAAVTDEGTLLLFDTGEEIRPPRRDVTNLVRTDAGLVLLAGGRLWVEEAGWTPIPLDPGHGMGAGHVQPLLVGDRLLAVGWDRGRILVYEWQP